MNDEEQSTQAAKDGAPCSTYFQYMAYALRIIRCWLCDMLESSREIEVMSEVFPVFNAH